MLDSHAVSPEASELLRQGDEDGFLKAREATMTNVVRAFAAKMAEKDFEDTQPLAEYDLDDDES